MNLLPKTAEQFVNLLNIRTISAVVNLSILNQVSRKG